jgi:hypothetical protein
MVHFRNSLRRAEFKTDCNATNCVSFSFPNYIRKQFEGQGHAASARGSGMERLGEIQVHFGGESVRAGEQGERCRLLREGVRIVESPVAPIAESRCQQWTAALFR